MKFIRRAIYIFIVSTLMESSISQEPNIGFEDLNVTGRPMPPELASLYQKKTDYELMMEECMVAFTECVSLFKQQRLCAIDAQGNKRMFDSLCQMLYENCKQNKPPSSQPAVAVGRAGAGANWRFISDVEC